MRVLGPICRRWPFAVAAIGCIIVAAFIARAADPSTLWNLVHGQCVPRAIQAVDPTPCTEVDLAGGTALLKDIDGVAQFLLIPTARVTGIEDPAILAADVPNYWHAAWQARRYLEQRIGHKMPRESLSLAINSAFGRSQNQLHIHVDCIRADVRDALQAHLAAVGTQWSDFPLPLAGQHYRAMRIEQPALDATDPFRLLAQVVQPGQMGQHTLVLAGVTFRETGPGFILLDDEVDRARDDSAHGEALQDHGCVLAR